MNFTIPSIPKVSADPANCEVCKTEKGKYVPHNNCLHPHAMGHSTYHCTADSCY